VLRDVIVIIVISMIIGNPMKTWALVSQKGGVGKSTIACHLAVHALACGEKAAIIDLDPQHNACDWFQLRDAPVPEVVAALHERLGTLKKSAERMGTTLLILDTPPHTATSSLAAIRASDLIITPSKPAVFDLLALDGTVKLLQQAAMVDRAVCVINEVPHQGAESAFEEAKQAAEGMGLKVCPAYLTHRRGFSASLASGKGITEFEPRGKSADELRALWERLSCS
jgi:chromosome partitioning protein